MNLQRAIEIAVEAHKDQVDKAGAPYILHPLRVMLTQKTDDAKIVAVLHDVLEDCPDWTVSNLRTEGFSEPILSALVSVSRREVETYDDFIRRVSSNKIGTDVKIADLRDNLDASRLPEINDDDLARFDKYRKALERLSSAVFAA